MNLRRKKKKRNSKKIEEMSPRVTVPHCVRMNCKCLGSMCLLSNNWDKNITIKCKDVLYAKWFFVWMNDAGEDSFKQYFDDRDIKADISQEREQGTITIDLNAAV